MGLTRWPNRSPQRSVFSAETGAIRDESPLFSRATKEAGGHELRGSRRDLQSRRLTLHTGDPLCGSGTPAHRLDPVVRIAETRKDALADAGAVWRRDGFVSRRHRIVARGGPQ